MKLSVIVTSTRPGRNGIAVGNWFHDHARQAGYDAELVDLAELALPIFDEPNHPRQKAYTKDHTKRWSAIVGGADAFVFVLPEYNFTAPPSYFNALDYLNSEWAYKPAGFVSYGGVSGGLRAVQAAKPILTTLKVMPVPEQVVLPMVFEHLSDGIFTPTDLATSSADALLAELSKWSGALKPLRG